MHTDPTIALADEIRKADLAFDHAAEAHDEPAAVWAGDRLIALTDSLLAATPHTAPGAAILLHEAADVLAESGDPVAPYFTRQINPIARRLARGDRRLADVIALRAAFTLAESRYAESDEALVPQLIAAALRGATAPMAIDGAARERANGTRSRAHLRLCPA